MFPCIQQRQRLGWAAAGKALVLDILLIMTVNMAMTIAPPTIDVCREGWSSVEGVLYASIGEYTVSEFSGGQGFGCVERLLAPAFSISLLHEGTIDIASWKLSRC